ncbi:uncharacterized protein BXZ73DRAFT_99977 [Epithele typhae]|uniref:uncharacterized protein n=1 Tax=Epithele typhae TaxID=378194 RepID=UPI0020083B41|nr:uncharacterized protein BXZ73DRAFT_99977 [Epithele typhae]KAH9937755.1 hypothetical protein BXZ73DRAFT_99977 [Epithele typhae]
MGSQPTLQNKWAVIGGALGLITYDHMISIGREVECAGITVAFDLMGAIIIMGAASFSSLRAYALCQRKYIAIIVLVLGCMNAVPSIYAAIRNRAGYNPGPNNLRTVCDVDFSQFLPLRNALCFVNLLNLILVNHVELLLNLLGIISTTTVVLTCRFILDLFEASDGTRMDTLPTVPSMAPSRAVAFRNVGTVSASGPSQGVFDADLTWRGADDGESVCDNKHDYGYELQVNPGRK